MNKVINKQTKKIENYYQCVAEIIKSKRDLINKLIDHKVTIGTYKENILKSVLRMKMPDFYKASRGFVITEEGSTTEIDILIYDSRYPVLYRDEDLVIVTSEAAMAIIEVKSSIDGSHIQNMLYKLSNNAQLIRKSKLNGNLHASLFSYNHSKLKFEQIEKGMLRSLLGIKKPLTKKERKEFTKEYDLSKFNSEILYRRLINSICITGDTKDLPSENKTDEFNELVMLLNEDKKNDNSMKWSMKSWDMKGDLEEAVYICDILDAISIDKRYKSLSQIEPLMVVAHNKNDINISDLLSVHSIKNLLSNNRGEYNNLQIVNDLEVNWDWTNG